ncbi:TPA: SEC10/PgrA surface exclusion domain-containing protein [Streptococcus suis]|nr:SEC10/PgrA surface exclusion domain-containing protein [Streptococcus suis]HEM4138550.1 SEC10/PgrA surface exclusion domain-containing protein [Streptococcus suis]
MTKQNNKLQTKGSIRKLRTGAVVSTLATSVIFGSAVSAEEVATTDVATTTEAVAVSEEVAQPVEVTQADVESAQAQVTELTNQVTAQEEVVAQVSAQVEELSAVTPEVVAELETAPAKEAVTSQEGVVSEAEKTVAEANTTVENAEKAVTEAQAEVDGLENIDETLKEAQATVVADEKAVEVATTQVDNLKVAEQDKAKAIATQEGIVSEAKTVVDTKSQALATVKTELATATNKVTETKATLDALSSTSTNEASNLTIPISTEYVNTLKEYIAGGSRSTELSNRLKELGAEAYKQVGITSMDVLDGQLVKFQETDWILKYSDYDKSRRVEVGNLTDAQRTELTDYFLTIIKPVREAFGVSEYKSSDKMNAIASRLETVTSVSNMSHDLSALSKVAKEFGLSGLYENLGFPTSDDGVETMATLKRDIFSQVMQMLYEDDHARWGHAKAFVTGAVNYVVVGVTDTMSGNIYGATRKLHFTLASGKHMAKLQDTNIRTAPSSATDTRATALANAKTAYNTALAQQTTASQKVSAIEFELQNAQFAYNSAKAELDRLKSGTSNLADAERTLAEATARLNASRQKLVEVQATYNNLKVKEAEAKQTLADAQKTLETAEITQAQAVARLDSEKVTLATLQGKLATAQGILDKARSTYAEAVQVRDELKAKLETARNAGTALAQAKADLEVAETRLADLEGILGQAEANLAYLKSLLPITSKGEPAYHELPTLEIPKELLDKVEVDGKVDAPVVAPVTSAPKVATPSKVGVEHGMSAEVLPNTGESENIMLYIGIGLLGLAGLSKKRNKRTI